MAHGYAHLYGSRAPVSGSSASTGRGAARQGSGGSRGDRGRSSYRALQPRSPSPGLHGIDDVVEVLRVLTTGGPRFRFDPADPRLDRSDAPFRIYNLGNDTNVDLLDTSS